MFRGTTPTLYFRINNIEDLSLIKDIWITLKDNKTIVFNKTLLNGEIDVDLENNIISITLTQQETLSIKSDEVKVQLKIRFKDDNVSVSPIFLLKVKEVLNTRVMKDDLKDPFVDTDPLFNQIMNKEEEDTNE